MHKGDDRMKIMVNDATLDVDAEATVETLVQQLGLNPARVAALRNGNIVERSLFAATAIEEGDVIDLVQFVPGG